MLKYPIRFLVVSILSSFAFFMFTAVANAESEGDCYKYCNSAHDSCTISCPAPDAPDKAAECFEDCKTSREECKNECQEKHKCDNDPRPLCKCRGTCSSFNFFKNPLDLKDYSIHKTKNPIFLR